MATHKGMKVLDHGYVKLIEVWGGGEANVPEAGIIEAARQSTQGAFRGWERDTRLLEYLYRHQHASPFEFAGMVIEVKAPIFVFREWHRHRTQSYNEMSARYAPIPDEHYYPSDERMEAIEDTGNKQSSGVTPGRYQHARAIEWRDKYLEAAYQLSERAYQEGLRLGIPKELARLPMAVGRYSKMRASANLRNWLAFMALRLDPAAQWEIRQYAQAVAAICRREFPRTMGLFDEVSA